MASYNPGKEPVCCLRCGRDTRATSGYCTGCGGSNRAFGKGRGYKSRDMRPVWENPLDETEDDIEDNRSDSDYHGSHLE